MIDSLDVGLWWGYYMRGKCTSTFVPCFPIKLLTSRVAITVTR
jgi:hypothetical protein